MCSSVPIAKLLRKKQKKTTDSQFDFEVQVRTREKGSGQVRSGDEMNFEIDVLLQNEFCVCCWSVVRHNVKPHCEMM